MPTCHINSLFRVSFFSFALAVGFRLIEVGVTVFDCAQCEHEKFAEIIGVGEM